MPDIIAHELITVNIVTNLSDEWFDSIQDADRFFYNLPDDEIPYSYIIYRDGVESFEESIYGADKRFS